MASMPSTCFVIEAAVPQHEARQASGLCICRQGRSAQPACVCDPWEQAAALTWGRMFWRSRSRPTSACAGRAGASAAAVARSAGAASSARRLELAACVAGSWALQTTCRRCCCAQEAWHLQHQSTQMGWKCGTAGWSTNSKTCLISELHASAILLSSARVLWVG